MFVLRLLSWGFGIRSPLRLIIAKSRVLVRNKFVTSGLREIPARGDCAGGRKAEGTRHRAAGVRAIARLGLATRDLNGPRRNPRPERDRREKGLSHPPLLDVAERLAAGGDHQAELP